MKHNKQLQRTVPAALLSLFLLFCLLSAAACAAVPGQAGSSTDSAAGAKALGQAGSSTDSAAGAKALGQAGSSADSAAGAKALGQAGGTSAGTADFPEKRLQVVTTIFPQYDFARHIAGDSADVHMLLKPGEEVHSYEPTPRDIKMIQQSDLFIYTGGENDVWVETILDSVEKGPRAVRLLDLVDTFAEEDIEGMMKERGHHHDEDHAHEEYDEGHTQEEHKEGDAREHLEEDHTHEEHDEEHGDGEEPDEHVWTSPANCILLIEKLTEEFCALDPAHEAAYRASGDAYRDLFRQLDREYLDMVSAAPRRTVLFGDRFPFRYLAEELGLTCYAAFPGCSSESEPSAATIAFLINKAAEEKLPVVFRIEFSNGNIARAIAEAAQLRAQKREGGRMTMQVLQLHSCHNVTRDEFEEGETCLSLMRKNLEILRTALNE